MEYIAHRINTLEELKLLDKSYGVEIDLRDYQDKLILEHDPFKSGVEFEDYLKEYNHGVIILNIKSEGIEYKVLDLLNKYNIKDYFFLDSSFPMIYKLSKEGINNIALRYSEFEGIDTILNMKDKISWVWIDCFTQLSLTKKDFDILKEANFKLCLVSPELQNQDQKIEEYKNYLQNENIIFDAICTKDYNIQRW